MLTLSLALSEACNLNCSYCNVDKKSKARINKESAVEQYTTLRAAHPNETIRIDFYGGEPLIQYDIIQHVLEALSNEPNVRFFMPTNGLLLTEERLEYLIRRRVEISLSFDGLWQDMHRPQLHKNKNTFHMFAARRELFTKIPNFSIHTMIYPGCYNLLENHLFLSEYGANPQLTVVEDRGVWDRDSVEKLKVGIDELYDWYINNTDKPLPNTIVYYLRSIVLYKAKNYETTYCGAGKTHLSFSEDKLVACNRFKDEPGTAALIPLFINMTQCQTCEIKNYCRKGCMYENIHNGGPIEELCDIIKHFVHKTKNMIGTLQHDANFRNVLKQMVEEEYGINNRTTNIKIS